MLPHPDPLSPDELLRHTQAMRALARGLVRDPAVADDLVQDSWLAFLRHPPRDSGATRNWLRTTLRNFAWRRGRRERRREARELAVARRESIDATPQEILERTELHRQVVDLVLDLEEPHRAVILDRFFAGLSPREIGEREGLPVTTVRSRLAKALERLRERLDRAHAGSRARWCLALASLAGLKVGTASASTALAASPASTAMSALETLASGGLVMTAKKTALVLAASALVLLSLGGLFLATRSAREASRPGERVALRDGGGGAGTGAPAAREPLPAGAGAGPAAVTATAAVAVPEAPLSLEGRVANAEGEGIAGAAVVAVEARAWHGILLGIEERYPDPLIGIQGLGREFADLRRRSPSAATTSDGSYRFRGLAEGEYRVLVSHPEYLPGPDARAAVAPGRTVRCDVELAAGGSVAGLVVDEEGKPVVGALVSSRSSQADSARGMGKVIGLLGRFVEGSALAAPVETLSARDGSFLLRGLEPALQDVHASLAGRLAGRLHQVPPGAQGVKLVLSRGAAVQGRLLDRAGQPAGGARLELKETLGSLPNKDAMMTADLDLLGEKTRSGESDAQGRFLITGVAPGQYELAIRSGKSPLLVEIIQVEKERVDLGELTVPDLAPIRGKVLGPKGQPVEGAVVRVKGGEEGPWRAAIAAAGLEGKSGPGGEFTIADVPAGQHGLSVTAPEHAASVVEGVPAGASDLVIRLGEAVVIAGVCLDAADRTPVAGAEIRPDGTHRPSQATSDEHGEFLLPCPASAAEVNEALRFHVSHPEYEGTWERGRPGAAEPVEVLLKPARGVHGTIRDGQGNPVAGARVQVEIPGFPQVLLAVTSDFNEALAPRYSDSGGRFFVRLPRGGRHLQEAPVDVAAQHPGHGKGRVRLSPAAESAAVSDVEIVLSPGVALEGRVLDSSGSPLPGAQVRATLWNDVPLEGEVAMMQLLLASSGGTVAYANRAGRFRLVGLEPSPHRLEVTALGYARKTIESVAAGGGGPPLDIVLESGGSISGRVVDLAGAPVAGVEVLAFFTREPVVPVEDVDITAMAAGQQVARSDREGVFSLTHLPETVFSVVARAPGFQLTRADNVRPGDAFPDLVLIPNGSLSGRIVDRATGQPVRFFGVRCERERPADGERAPRGANEQLERSFEEPSGTFRFEDLAAGRYRVRISTANYRTFRGTVEVEPGREAAFEARLEPGLRIEGVVRAMATRAPLAGAKVVLAIVSPAGEGGAPRRASAVPKVVTVGKTTTGEDGAFAFGPLDPGDYDLFAEHAQFFLDAESGARRLSLSDGQAEPIDLLLSPAGSIRGRLRSRRPLGVDGFHEVLATRVPEEGEKAAAPRPELILRGEDEIIFEDDGPGKLAPAEMDDAPGEGDGGIRARVQANGEYLIEGLRPGTYRLAIARYEEPLAPGDLAKSRGPVRKGEPADAGLVEVAAGEVKTADLDAP